MSSQATSCLKCEKPIEARGLVTCAACGATQVLVLGRGLDPAIEPPPVNAAWADVTVRASGALARYQAVLRRTGLAFGMLDPIVARVMMESKDGPLRYEDVESIAAMRKISIGQVVLFVLLTLPFVVGPGIGFISTLHPAGIGFGLFFLALAGLHGWRTFGLKALRLRVVGAGRTCDLTVQGQGRPGDVRARAARALRRSAPGRSVSGGSWRERRSRMSDVATPLSHPVVGASGAAAGAGR